MITLVASTRRATAVSDDAITTRSVGIPVTLDLSEHFDGLAVTLVCKAGDVSRDIAVLDPDALEVPVDCLQVAGVPLLLGLVGKNSAGTIVIRTTMASAGTIRVGTEESDVDPSDPVPDWTVQVQQWAEDAHDTAERLAQEVDGWQDDIDAAVEGAENVNATVSKSGSVATISVTDREGVTHTATVSDGAAGPAGPAGPQGEKGDTGDPAAPGSITDEMLAPDGIKPQVAQLFGNQLTGELSGTIATASDAYTAPPMALTVEGASTQAGTPTPDAPVPILSVDELALKVHGKNILDPSFLTRCGWTKSGDTYTGTPKQLYQGLTNHILPVECAANTQYVFAWYQVSSTNTSNTNTVDFRFVYSDGTQSASKYTDLNHTFTAVSAEGKTVVGLRFSYVSNPTLVVKCVQLVPLVAWSGSVEENYQPYITPITVPDLLPEGTTLRSLPDGTRDTLNLSYLRPSTRTGWAWYSRELVQNTSTLDDITSLTWNLVTYGTSKYQATLVGCRNGATNQSIEVMCSTLAGAATRAATADITGEPNTIRMRQGYGILMVPPDTDVTILSGTLLYPLATPVTTQLDPIELPTLPAPTATVWCDGGSATPTFQMQYVQDTNIVIAELRAALADLATS